MNGTDYLIINGIKSVFHFLPGTSGTSALMGGMMAPLAGIFAFAILGQMVVCIIDSSNLKNSKHVSTISWILTLVGMIGVMVIIL